MLEFDGEAIVFLGIGIATLAAALLPRVLGRVPVSMPMVFLAAGILLFTVAPALPNPSPLEYPEVALHLTEVCVIISLMGAGLAINRVVGLRRWSTTWRLLAIAMPLCILAVALLGWWFLGLGVASALLLAAALAPTDPVLATEVQVSEPVDDPGVVDDEARFALTSEAGLNDGLAFPFTWAAIAVSLVGIAPGAWLGQWFLVDVIWRLGVGALAGLGIGWLFGKLFFATSRFARSGAAEGFVAIAATFVAYGAAEIAEGYGFVAVFVAACAIRASERHHEYHSVLHTFVEQIERLLTVTVVILLGGAVARGLLSPLQWQDVVVAAALILLIRPLSGLIALTPGKTGPRERGVIAFFGVRGIGSFFYIAFALSYGDFPNADRLWAIVALVVVGSIIIHGIAATPAMRMLDRERARAAAGKPDSTVEETPV